VKKQATQSIKNCELLPTWSETKSAKRSSASTQTTRMMQSSSHPELAAAAAAAASGVTGARRGLPSPSAASQPAQCAM